LSFGTFVGWSSDCYARDLRNTSFGLDQSIDQFRFLAGNGQTLFRQHGFELDDGVFIAAKTTDYDQLSERLFYGLLREAHYSSEDITIT
jgi:hypothetical protein